MRLMWALTGRRGGAGDLGGGDDGGDEEQQGRDRKQRGERHEGDHPSGGHHLRLVQRWRLVQFRVLAHVHVALRRGEGRGREPVRRNRYVEGEDEAAVVIHPAVAGTADQHGPLFQPDQAAPGAEAMRACGGRRVGHRHPGSAALDCQST
jgi:hypothetical protein